MMSTGRKVLLFDVLNKHVSSVLVKKEEIEKVDNDKLIDSLNILTVWNKEHEELKSQVYIDDEETKLNGSGSGSGSGNGSSSTTDKKISTLMEHSFCC